MGAAKNSILKARQGASKNKFAAQQGVILLASQQSQGLPISIKIKNVNAFPHCCMTKDRCSAHVKSNYLPCNLIFLFKMRAY